MSKKQLNRIEDKLDWLIGQIEQTKDATNPSVPPPPPPKP
tara:strand:+ start:1119 stop:1238 length:120 start_codon:yes stop_codon:yes gene_type:complete